MNDQIRAFLMEAKAREGIKFATVAECILKIGGWLKNIGLPVGFVAAAVDRIAPTVEECVETRPKAMMVIAVEPSGLTMLASESDAELDAFMEGVVSRGGGFIGINPRLVEAEVVAEGARRVH
jgi:hypothetical protein